MIVAAAISQVRLYYFDSYILDLKFQLRPNPTPSGQVILVQMDQKTAELEGGFPGYVTHQKVLENILASQALAVGYVTPLVPLTDSDISIARSQASPTGSDQERQAFVQLLQNSQNVYQLVDSLSQTEDKSDLALPSPFQGVRVLAAPKTRDSGVLANDGITRRVMVDYAGLPLGHLELARLINPELGITIPLRGAFDFYETQQLLIDFTPSGHLPTVKFESLKDAPLAQLKGKIVLIGDDFQNANRAYVQTPFSREPMAMSYLEMNGNMLETFIRNSAPTRPPTWFNFLVILVISVLTVRAVMTMKPVGGLSVLLTSAVVLGLVSFLAFIIGNLDIPLAHPLLAIFICYYFFIPYRLIVENRRSWEYYQKHQLLQQVEVLKTNFISMMSHDLKTPIARIQGMTDVILKDPVVLSSGQREALDHIRSSGNDLLRFINAILNYAKIESEGVELHTESRDINELLNSVIHKNEFLAKMKNISLIAELEPLFSIKLDPELIKQVFSNLVENAIKYSPDGTKILISSEERDGWVVIQVADQGPGIPADELQNIFMKFFRSRNAKASPIKGSGLGLYLAKYFVELHKGKISVESQLGHGTTFTVELPVQAQT